MSDQNKDSFHRRLQRIIEDAQSPDASHSHREETHSTSESGDTSISAGVSRRRDNSQLISMLIVVGILGGGLVLVLSELRDHFAQLSRQKSVSVSVANTAQDTDLDDQIPENTNSFTRSEWGWVATGKVVIDKNGQAFALPQIAQAELAASGQADQNNSKAPKVFALRPNAECAIKRLNPDHKLINLQLGKSTLDGPVHNINEAELALALVDQVDYVKRSIGLQQSSVISVGNSRGVNLFVTDTSAPLHMVLQSRDADTIWNLHTAPGVKLAHITMIAIGHAGVAGVPDNTPVELLSARDFVTDFSTDGLGVEWDCFPVFTRRPNENWSILDDAPTNVVKALDQKSQTPALVNTDLEARFLFADRYNKWLTSALELDHVPEAFDAWEAGHLLIGPPPDPALPFVPAWEKPIYLVPRDYIFVGPTSRRRASVQKLQNALMTEAIGIDPSKYVPVPFEKGAR